MTVTPEIRRANRLVLLCLIVFALGLCLAVFLWMRAKIRQNGGIVDPVVSMRLERLPKFSLDQPALLL